MKNIATLVDDIYSQLQREGGWDEAVHGVGFGKAMEAASNRRFLPSEAQPKGTLRMSNLGRPCSRQLYYDVNENHEGTEELEGNTLFKFFFGDMIEEATLSLAKAAGHTVEGEQEEVNIQGIKGHYDAIIDGMLIDVKSCSTFAFKKFKNNGVRADDPFGYIAQLSSYLYCLQDDDRVTYKNKAGFLAVDKQNGSICLDVYDLTEELKWKEVFVENRINMVADDEPPSRQYAPEEDGKSGNMKLCTACSYCKWKDKCWPDLRTFLYAGRPRFLTKVVKEPNVPEAT